MRQKFLNLSLIQKMAVLLFSLLLVPVLLISTGTMIFMVRSTLREQYKEIFNRMDRSMEYLSRFDEILSQVSIQCFTNMALQRIANGKGSSRDYMTLRDSLDQLLRENPVFSNISFIKDGENLFQSGLYMEPDAEEEERLLVQYFSENPQKNDCWQFPSSLHIPEVLKKYYGNAYSNDNKMTYYSIIYDYFAKSYSEPLGYLAITVDGDAFQREYKDYLPDLVENAFLVNADGRIFSDTDGSFGAAYEWADRLRTDEGEGRFVKNGQEILWEYNKALQMTLVCTYPAALTWKKQMPMLYLMAAILVLLAVFFAFYRYMEKRIITRPINEMAIYFKKMENGTFETMQSSGRKDEVGQLQTAYNSMVDRVQTLTSKVLAVELEKKEAELQALSSHINPHFLYNTLDSIHWKAILNRDTDVAEQVLALSDVYRYILSRGKEAVTFREEYEFEKKYFYLMKMRFDERVSYDLRFAPETFDIAFPKLIVQPLIENAIVHGLEPTVEGGTVTVEVALEGEDLSITVTDDGIGFDRQIDLKNDEIEKEIQSFALTNINHRLRLYFDEYDFSVISAPGKGCTAMIHVPEVKKYAFDDRR